MTDDDRIDRAERIRRMREGRSSDETDDTSETEQEESAEQDTDEMSDADPDKGAEHGADGTSETDTATDPDDTESDETGGEQKPLHTETPESPNPAAAPEASSNDGENAESVTDRSDTPGQDREIEASPASSARAGTAASANTATDDQSAGQTATTGGEAAVTETPTEITEEMTAAQVARALGQQTDTTTNEQAGMGARSGDAELSLQAGSVSGQTIVDETFFEAGGRAQIIEFSIGDEYFAIDVGYVGEIIETPEVTRMPNTPDCVEGVVDLRGKVTAVMDPSPVLASEARLQERALIVVLDVEAIDFDGTVGWLVDDVRQVTTIADDQVTDPPEAAEWTRGIVDRTDESFVTWADPTEVLDEVDTSTVEKSTPKAAAEDAE